MVCAEIVDTFKNRSDNFLQDQEVLFNWKEDILLGVEVQLVLF